MSSPDAPVVIIGAGQAGVTCAESLRSGGWSGTITLLGDEPHGPYHRPPLSKAWLAGELDEARLVMRAPEALARKRITLRTGVRVVSIDRAARQVQLADGERLPYGGLVLATGARPRHLPLPGSDAAQVLPLRSLDDASRIAAGLARCAELQRPVVVIGGGFIGLEVAATARDRGLAVTVLEAGPRLLGRVLAPMLSHWYARLHQDHGVQLRLEARPEAIESDAGGVSAVRLADGSRLPCALVVLGVGVQADDGLARQAGLETEHGIVVDDCARTADPRIAAAGDCTARRLADGTLLRLESVQNATEQAKSAAAALLGQARPFTTTPWFWSDQYDRKLQMAGLSGGAEAWALRGELGGASFSVWHYRAGRLVAVDAVNAPRDHLQARRLLDAGLTPTPAQVEDAGFDLGSLPG
ncbi:3-phenylpropionate/trans-cinnamate dioxygenase ferredoxin reductase subunit [Sphaerotilus hippei]|uniref:3-phenylpropionate/trans-cinnamate dioxygenase ferredoxin reductase subunit n=1 Tax=Sphaerotilus hippei TaxID=744406 RepID=A0A318H5X8_9BURK|nr:FAD-dependent oxidoreductase [Sphaerotilus hippei]PXW97651.1 3-phenylpropionate/trans-cinnamate dioxygenase ferredoxin reductase subunit [Sphaerotilus hippei]